MSNRLSLALSLLLLAACVAEAPDPRDPRGRTPSEIEAERVECLATGGTFTRAGLGGLTCLRPTSDAGQSCSRGTDCEGFCLAKSRSCAPQTPLFGCFPILDDDGQEVQICVD